MGNTCAPGMPKMWSIPRRSRYLTINSLTEIFMCLIFIVIALSLRTGTQVHAAGT